MSFCFTEKEKELTDDGHEGVKVADVEAFARHVDEELDDSSSVLLLHRLLTKWRTLKNYISPQERLHGGVNVLVGNQVVL